MRSVEEHLARCLSLVAPLAPKRLPLLAALGLVLAEDVVAAAPLPGFSNASMDGYAVLAADVATASAEHPITLPVSADVAAGPAQHRVIAPGTAVRIMTGAPAPQPPDGAGFDALAVVPVEWTDAGAERVTINQAPDPGAYLRHPGEDVQAGELVLRAGSRLGARQLGLAAAAGRAEVLVHPAPRVVVVSTGSELVPAGEPLGYGQIHDSNGPALTAAALQAGAHARHGGFVPDDIDGVLATLHAAAESADLLLTSGGVSAGVYDVVKAALRHRGSMEFDKVAMQPGMPQGAGIFADVPVVTLPGNPVSSMVSFEVFARPMLGVLAGRGPVGLPAVVGHTARGWSSPSGKRQFARATIVDGVIEPAGGQGSHLVADLARANCLAVVPENVAQVEPGDQLTCLLLERD